MTGFFKRIANKLTITYQNVILYRKAANVAAYAELI